MQVDLQVEVPKGFELTGEYRPPKTDEWFLRWDGQQIKSTFDSFNAFLILRKVDTWRDATLDDLKRVMDGETVECRAYSECDKGWINDYLLTGWAKGEHAWRVTSVTGYSFWYRKVQVKE
ncbi:MAG: hypothetical protein ACK52I_29600 [Pseudomonadota bacterium]